MCVVLYSGKGVILLLLWPRYIVPLTADGNYLKLNVNIYSYTQLR